MFHVSRHNILFTLNANLFFIRSNTLYKVDSAGVAKAVTNESGTWNVGVNHDGYATNSIFISHDTVFSTNSKGGVSINTI